ncbi:MAG: DUF1778 domain-containing protein [Deltaproteobacteria bacterium]|nr:DUF1778 domain-containing protein [Deltaproteobacteria bacterium]
MTTSRIDMRISEETKTLVERAAAAMGQTVTAFAQTALMNRAQQVLSERETTLLTARDRELFLQVLDDKPNAVLRKAAAKHKAGHGRR